jgi:hypothetical protein
MMLPEEEHDTERLTEAQVSRLLEIAVESRFQRDLDRLASLPTVGLLSEVRTVLSSNGLGAREAAALLGVNELTMKAWLNSGKPLQESVHNKLAALRLLLLASAGEAECQESALLVRTAVAQVTGKGGAPTSTSGGGPADLLSSVFGPTGLMAAAMSITMRFAIADGIRIER